MADSTAPVAEVTDVTPAIGKRVAVKQTNAKKTAKPKKITTHPSTTDMVENAIKNLKERGGSSLQAIKKHIADTYEVDIEKLAPLIRKYIKSAVASGTLVQTTGKGASGSFKLSTASPKTKKVATKKPAAGTGEKAKAPTQENKNKASTAIKKAKSSKKTKVAAVKSKKASAKEKKLEGTAKENTPKVKKAAGKPKAKKVAAKPKAPNTQMSPGVKTQDQPSCSMADDIVPPESMAAPSDKTGEASSATSQAPKIELQPLHSDSCKGKDEDILRMRQLLTQYPASLEEVQSVVFDGYRYNFTPLMHAAHKGHQNCVEFLLEKGANGSTLVTRFSTLLCRRPPPRQYPLICFLINEPHEHRMEIGNSLLKHGFFATTEVERKSSFDLINVLTRNCFIELEDVDDLEVVLKFYSKNYNNFIRRTKFISLVRKSLLAFYNKTFPMLRLLLLYGVNFDFVTDEHSTMIMLISKFQPFMVHMYAKKYIEFIKLYHAFNGERQGWKNEVIEYLNQHEDVVEAGLATVRSELDEILHNPMSLQGLARLTIRNCMGKNYMMDYDKLGLPNHFKSFMRFEDIEQEEMDSDDEDTCYTEPADDVSEPYSDYPDYRSESSHYTTDDDNNFDEDIGWYF